MEAGLNLAVHTSDGSSLFLFSNVVRWHSVGFSLKSSKFKKSSTLHKYRNFTGFNKGTTNELCLKWKEMFETVLFILLGKYLKQIDIMK